MHAVSSASAPQQLAVVVPLLAWDGHPPHTAAARRKTGAARFGLLQCKVHGEGCAGAAIISRRSSLSSIEGIRLSRAVHLGVLDVVPALRGRHDISGASVHEKMTWRVIVQQDLARVVVGG